MKRLGLRSSLLSTEIKVDAETKAQQTTEPQLFYDRVLAFRAFLLIIFQSVNSLQSSEGI